MKLTRLFTYSLLLITLVFNASAGPFDVKRPLPEQAVSVYKLIISTASKNEQIGSCTGWVGENKEGELRIVTNAHCCVDNGLEVNPEVGELTNITLADGRPLKRFIFDPFADICLLSIEGDTSKEKPLYLAAKPTEIMDSVTVVGHPNGRPLEAYSGYRINSALIPSDFFDPEVVIAYGETQFCMPLPGSPMCLYLRQSDTYNIHIEPGNSGSPLINKAGEVVGLIWGIGTFNDNTFAASLGQLKRYLK